MTLQLDAIHEMLAALFFDHKKRAAFVARGGQCGDDEREVELNSVFETVDLPHLKSSVQRLRRNFLEGFGGKASGLVGNFENMFSVLASLDGRFNVEDFADQFISSEYYAKCSNVPYIRGQLGVEEAFYLFVQKHYHPIPEPLEEIVRRDAIMALYRNIAGSRVIDFPLPASWCSKTGDVIQTIQSYKYDLETYAYRPHRVLYQAQFGEIKFGEIFIPS